MAVIRTYACDDCGLQFEVTQAMADSAPECPNCTRVLEWVPGNKLNIIGNKARAIDVTQSILENDFGLTNFNDNMREGDIAAKVAAPPTQAEQDRQVRQLSEVAQAYGQPSLNPTQAEMAKAFWSGGQTPLQKIPAAEMLSAAKAATADVNAQGLNPMKLLHDAGKRGQLKTPINVIARA